LAGLHDSVKALCPNSKLVGFKGGTLGLFAQDTVEIDADALVNFRNMGGFHMLGRSVDMILTPEQQHKAMQACQERERTA
jgi:pyrophosphate--fructose-6-phosphate 1-phosphotransferase